MKKSLSFYALFFMLSMVVMRLSGVLSKVLLARLITPYEYGIIVLVAISLPAMMQIITNLFFFDLLSHSGEGHKYFGFSMLYSTVVSVGLGAVVYLFHDVFLSFLNLPKAGWESLFAAFILVLLPTSLLVNLMGILRGLQKYSLSSMLSTAPSVLRLFIIFFAVYVIGVKSFGEILFYFAIPVLIVLLFVLVKERESLLRRIYKIEVPAKEMLVFGLAVYVINVFVTVNQTIASIMVSHTLGVEMAAFFDVSFSLATILTFSFGAMQFICIPEATKKKDKKELLFQKGGLGETVRGLFAFLIYCVIVLFFYSSWLIGLMFSKSYLKGAEYVYILAIGYIFLFLQQFLSYVNVSMSNNLKEYSKFFVESLILIILMPFVTSYLISSLGFVGAYISTTGFLIVYTLLTVRHSKDLAPLHVILKGITRLIFSAASTFALIYFFNPPVLLGIALSATAYFLLIFVSGYLHKDYLFELINLRK
jgi:O-antigen/teichoic acid export membrane protein